MQMAAAASMPADIGGASTGAEGARPSQAVPAMPAPGDGAAPTGGTMVTAGAGGAGEMSGNAAAPSVPAAGDEQTPAAAPMPAEEMPGQGAPAPEADEGSDRVAFPAVEDPEQMGPFATSLMQRVGPSSLYTVYRPRELGKDGVKHPVVGWMSGGGTTHTLYTLPTVLASHGFIVVAADVVPGIGQEAMLGKQIIDGIDWALAENEREGSELFGKLDPGRIASSGYSMGSLATFMIASDPRLTTTVHISGGNMAPERVSNLHAPAAFICGTPGPATCGLLDAACDLAAANCDRDFEGAQTPVFYANFTGGHLGILTPPMSDMINGMTVAWLRYKLMDDATFGTWFTGPDCVYCQDSRWKVQRKALD